MSKPTFPRWADTVAAIPSEVDEPNEAKKDIGWLVEMPPRRVQNWLQLQTYLALRWAEAMIEKDEPVMLRSGSPLSWSGTQLSFGGSIGIHFRSNVAGALRINQIQSGGSPISMNNGDVVVVRKDRTGASPVSLTLQGTYANLVAGEYCVIAQGSLAVTNYQDEMILFRRNGSDLEIPAHGTVIPSGTIFRLGEAPSSSLGAVPVGTVIAWDDYNGALTLPSNYAYCDGSVISNSLSPLNGQNTRDLSNRYIVGYGTEGGGDIDTAAYNATVVGNSGHTVNLQHSHTVNSHSHDVDIGSFSSGDAGTHSHVVASHVHSMTNHTHTIPAHAHDGDGLYALVTLNDGSGSNGDGLFMQTMAVGSWNANRGDDVGGNVGAGTSYNNAAVVDGTTDSFGPDVSGAAGAAFNTGSAAPNTDVEPDHSHTVNPPNTTSTSSAPGTNNQLSTTQSIQPRSMRLRFAIRIY